MKHILDDYGEAIIYAIIGLSFIGLFLFVLTSIS